MPDEMIYVLDHARREVKEAFSGFSDEQIERMAKNLVELVGADDLQSWDDFQCTEEFNELLHSLKCPPLKQSEKTQKRFGSLTVVTATEEALKACLKATSELQGLLADGPGAIQALVPDWGAADSHRPQYAAVDWDVAYLVLRDWHQAEEWLPQCQFVVCNYMGLDPNKLSESAKPSAARKAKLFAGCSLSDVSRATGLSLSTLNDWFKTRKIPFHAMLEFAHRTQNGNESVVDLDSDG